MRKIVYTAFISASILFVAGSAYSQVTITGATCAVPGTVYQYSISGPWDSTSTMSVCVHGGSIADSADSNECTLTGVPVSRVLVDWDTSGSWTLTVTSSSGSAVLTVSVTAPLTPGTIDSSAKVQFIGLDSVPSPIACAAATGGSCSPLYLYQWQQSLDAVNWTDMTGATGQTLGMDSALTQTWFYRRKDVEGSSGSIGYSDIATVFVGIGQASMGPKPSDSSHTYVADAGSTVTSNRIFTPNNLGR